MQAIAGFMKGNGLDVSKKPELAKSLVSGVRHFYRAPDQLYSLEGQPRDLDFVSCLDGLLDTKYYPVQMREWFNALKKGGHLVVRFEEYDNLKVGQFKMDFALYFNKYLKLIRREKQGKEYTYVFRKISGKPDPDEMDSWSFGIITLGTRNEWVEQMIRSIVKQKIKNFEIIVCGKYFEREEPYVRYVEMPKDDIPNLTRKKNRICEEAKYENIVVLHDRVVLEDGWFEGMKKWGNDWDFLGCSVEHNGNRSYDWFSTGYPTYLGEFDQQRAALLYDDWDRWAVTNAGIFILKKRVWNEVKWNEQDYYPGNDDMIYCTDLENRGFIPRFNPYAKCKALSFHALDLLYHEKDSRKIGKIKGPLVERAYWAVMSSLYKAFVNNPSLRGVRDNFAWKAASGAFKKARMAFLGGKVEDRSWSKVNKQEII
ncbi:hypothetical protein HZC09_00100 [Candidatus Micrarchaeota archaeon]|nr:hypothetical protein [Candidatus Micrarchaeota archaeon]